MVEQIINKDVLKPTVDIEELLNSEKIYTIKNHQKFIDDKYYYISCEFNNIYFGNRKGIIEINITELHNYKIMTEDNINLSSCIFDSRYNQLINETVEIIYMNHLKNEKCVNLSNIYGSIISRYKLILKTLKQIFINADFNIIKNEESSLIIKWSRLL